MHYINISDLADRNWRFVEPLCDSPHISWDFRYGHPWSSIERIFSRPAIGRYRAVLSAVFSARRRSDAVLVSHLPNVSIATAAALHHTKTRRPHIAFSFNFTDLPKGDRLERMRRYFSNTSEFVVYSRYERELYAGVFDIPVERFHFLPWAMDQPVFDPDFRPPFDSPYLCSIGGEGRDYGLLAEVLASLPTVPMVIVARPHSIIDIAFPPNVRVFANLSAPHTWALARRAAGMVVPLRSAGTANGHITLVGAQLLEIPLIVTRSEGVLDYVDDDNAALVPPADRDAMRTAILGLLSNDLDSKSKAKRARLHALSMNSPEHWARYFVDLDMRLSAGQLSANF